jgi:hypothetical protein
MRRLLYKLLSILLTKLRPKSTPTIQPLRVQLASHPCYEAVPIDTKIDVRCDEAQTYDDWMVYVANLQTKELYWVTVDGNGNMLRHSKGRIERMNNFNN